MATSLFLYTHFDPYRMSLVTVTIVVLVVFDSICRQSNGVFFDRQTLGTIQALNNLFRKAWCSTALLDTLADIAQLDDEMKKDNATAFGGFALQLPYWLQFRSPILGDYDPEVLQRAVQIQNCVVESTTLRVQIGTAAATAKAWEKDIAVELEERLKFECKQLEKLDEMLSVAGTVGAIVSMPVVCSAWDTLCAQLFSRGCQARHWVAICKAEDDSASRNHLHIFDGKCESPYWVEKAALIPKSEWLARTGYSGEITVWVVRKLAAVCAQSSAKETTSLPVQTPMQPLPQSTVPLPRKVDRWTDLTHQCRITKESILSLFRHAGYTSEAAAAFDAIDLNCLGKIDRKEFLKAFLDGRMKASGGPGSAPGCGWQLTLQVCDCLEDVAKLLKEDTPADVLKKLEAKNCFAEVASNKADLSNQAERLYIHEQRMVARCASSVIVQLLVIGGHSEKSEDKDCCFDTVQKYLDLEAKHAKDLDEALDRRTTVGQYSPMKPILGAFNTPGISTREQVHPHRAMSPPRKSVQETLVADFEESSFRCTDLTSPLVVASFDSGQHKSTPQGQVTPCSAFVGRTPAGAKGSPVLDLAPHIAKGVDLTPIVSPSTR